MHEIFSLLATRLFFKAYIRIELKSNQIDKLEAIYLVLFSIEYTSLPHQSIKPQRCSR